MTSGADPRGLLGVYADPLTVRDLTERLRAGGVQDRQVQVDQPVDKQTALVGEVRQEVEQSYVSPQVGVVYPKETVKAGAVFGPPLVALGAVAGGLAGWFLDVGQWDAWLEVLVGAIVGAVSTGTIAAIMIPAMSVKNPQDPSPVEEGITVRVDEFSPDIERMMAEARPLRLERLAASDQPVATVLTEEDQSDEGIIEEVGENFAREQGAEPEERTR
jgi:hypothetical protein